MCSVTFPIISEMNMPTTKTPGNQKPTKAPRVEGQ